MSQESLFDAPAAPDGRDVLARVHRGAGVDKKVQARLIAHGLIYLRTSDYRHRLTPVGRRRLGIK